MDVVHDHAFMLTQPHREVLARKYGVYPWVVEQYEWEGVLIPGGCAHQVRNLRSCIKIALDFVSPESLHECLKQREEMRQLSLRERPELKADEVVELRHFQDKLQVANMAIHALSTALDVLSEKKDGA
jgi:lysine-specific demethylase 3